MKKKRKYVILSYMLIYSKLMLYFFSFYNFLFFRLLADAKVLKYIPQHLIRLNRSAHDFSQVIKTFAKVL